MKNLLNSQEIVELTKNPEHKSKGRFKKGNLYLSIYPLGVYQKIKGTDNWKLLQQNSKVAS